MYSITTINNSLILFGACPDSNTIPLSESINSYKLAGVDLIVSLLEEHEQIDLNLEDEEKICSLMGLSFYHFPIPDMSIPSLARFTDNIDCLYKYTYDKKMIYIHCRHGIGRSSLVTAGLMLRGGMILDDVLELISQKRGLLVPATLAQRKLIWSYAKTINSKDV